MGNESAKYNAGKSKNQKHQPRQNGWIQVFRERRV